MRQDRQSHPQGRGERAGLERPLGSAQAEPEPHQPGEGVAEQHPHEVDRGGAFADQQQHQPEDGPAERREHRDLHEGERSIEHPQHRLGVLDGDEAATGEQGDDGRRPHVGVEGGAPERGRRSAEECHPEAKCRAAQQQGSRACRAGGRGEPGAGDDRRHPEARDHHGHLQDDERLDHESHLGGLGREDAGQCRRDERVGEDGAGRAERVDRPTPEDPRLAAAAAACPSVCAPAPGPAAAAACSPAPDVAVSCESMVRSA
ncbi:hypothetical protein [Arsenicicoccus piscis]|uniref:Uncharacterized protein n=1 Tax=Arsenicicoccus piscis TaxID=673954 RepID=A0ABQ6HPQ7_9MICO|nr:hypothetical protein [Arsenicicoccus piscis]GMA20326.1 hypothetical protein GCM10025862_23470 [Arsenicicoccus piscis]